MPQINILSPHVADLIAAGEVVERDAGARTIVVELRAGGRERIRVTDDGCGMAPEDAGVCFLRHATSKLHDERGLECIGTLGFRGEALAAIAAVSRVTLTTRLRGADAGVRMEVAAGEILEAKLKETLHLESVTLDTLKTLELFNEGKGFTVAGELLADRNRFPGVDMVRFGDSINILLDRETHAGVSILRQYDDALQMYRKYYQYEQIEGSARKGVSLIPEEAFREAIANALAHRTWDVDTHIHVAMFPDKIEITSPGGLPQGVSEEEYLRGGISVLRNRIIGGVFFRLHLIERFGTGIRRIYETYKDSNVKPAFAVSENALMVTLPVLSEQDGLTEDERKVYAAVRKRSVASSVIMKETGFGKTKVLAILRKLTEQGYVTSSGNGRGVKYRASV